MSTFKVNFNYLEENTIDTSLVTLPSYEHVKLILYLNGFDSNLLVNSNEYRKNLRYKQRKFCAVILGAQKSLSSFYLESLASSHERYFIFHISYLTQIFNKLPHTSYKSTINFFFNK